MRGSRPYIAGENNPFFGKIHTEETRQKISKANKGRYIGEKSPNYGKPLSDERKALISEQKSVPVCQFDTEFYFIAEYSSSVAAELVTGIQSTHIRRACNGVLNTAGGFIWFHKSDCNNDFEKVKMEYLERVGSRKKSGIMKRKTNPVCKLDLEWNLLQEYETVAEASRDTGIHGDTIRFACKNGLTTTGYIWMFKKDYEKLLLEKEAC